MTKISKKHAREQAQRARDLRRYEEAMRAKRRAEAVYGPAAAWPRRISPNNGTKPKLRLVTDAVRAGASGISSSCNSSRK